MEETALLSFPLHLLDYAAPGYGSICTAACSAIRTFMMVSLLAASIINDGFASALCLLNRAGDLSSPLLPPPPSGLNPEVEKKILSHHVRDFSFSRLSGSTATCHKTLFASIFCIWTLLPVLNLPCSLSTILVCLQITPVKKNVRVWSQLFVALISLPAPPPSFLRLAT